MKRMVLLLAAVALSTAALATGPARAISRPTCQAPACFRTPGCCSASDCSTYCKGVDPTSAPVCLGECCECVIVA